MQDTEGKEHRAKSEKLQMREWQVFLLICEKKIQ